MTLSDETIRSQSPWWSDPGWQASDPHLTLLEQQPMRLEADLVSRLNIRTPAIHILRGPRQVGKSTDLKLLAVRALDEGRAPRSIVYVSLELFERQSLTALADAIERARQLAQSPTDGILLLLDEVTTVERWQTAVKYLWDQGPLREDVVVCTGSSAIDLQTGAADRLPGRRGAGEDHLVLPQSFASFARAVDPTIPASPRSDIAALRTDEGRDLLDEARFHGPALKRALERYLLFGGLPAAVGEAASGAVEPSAQTKKVVFDSFVKEVGRKGASRTAAHALLERVLRSLGSKVSWSTMAREMGVSLGHRPGTKPSHHTVRDYIELMAGAYNLVVVYFWRSGSGTNALSRDKKVLFADPLLHTIALDKAPGLRADIPALVENVVGMTLLRRYEPPEFLIEAFAWPDRLHVWHTSRGGEIDFACGRWDDVALVEVKYGSDPGRRAASAAARAHPGRPVVVVTKDHYSVQERYTLVPAATLLWALG